MNIEKKYLNGGLSADAADWAVEPNSYVNMENARFGSTFFAEGSVGGIESIGSSELISSAQPSMQNYRIGSIYDQQRNRIIWMNWSSIGAHQIKCYEIDTGITYVALYDSQITGGLNFDKNSLIHSMGIVNGMLYFVEGDTNQPRKINIDSAIAMNYPSYVTDAQPYQSPLDFDEITIIKPPPALAPNIVKDTDGAFVNNFIANDSFMFVFQYTYYDNETSVVGTYSPASKLNSVTDTFNRIIVTMDLLERIPNTVRLVNLFVRTGNGCFNIKVWDREVLAERAEIFAQNNGVQVLTYNFYNNITGPFLPSSDVLKPFDSVPIFSGSMELAKGRLMLADNIEGYDAPLVTSLSTMLIIVPVSGSTLVKNLIQVSWIWWNRHREHPSDPSSPFTYFGGAYSGWYIYINASEISGTQEGYYAITSTEQYDPVGFHAFSPPAIPTFPAAPTSITLTDLTFRGLPQSDVLNGPSGVGYNPSPQPPPPPGNPLPGDFYYRQTAFTITSNMVDITGITVTTYNIYKSRSAYNAGVAFYDFAVRKCSVVTNGLADINIPARDYSYTSAVSNIAWSLSNTNAINEIPEWAYYFAPLLTKNLTTRFFIESFDDGSKYVTKDADGNYVYTNDTYITTAVAIGINTTALVRSGLGYVFSQGDVCVVTRSSDSQQFVLPVIGQDGNYVLVKGQDIGDFSSITIVYEIYTPYQTNTQEPYYEMGNMYRIINPTTDDRQYETLSGFFNADAFALTRNYNSTTYFAEAMSPNDLFYQRWDTDAGKVNIISKLGQQHKTQSISFSNTFIPGTSVNGLSTFEALNQKSVPLECGTIEKLQLSSKVQDQGTVMLAICNKETVSIYLGETRITDSTGASQFFGVSNDVIGTINVLKGSFGTMNPESVLEFKGVVLWADVNNGKYIQYGANGLFPISSYRVNKFWKLFSETYKSLTKEQIEALGSRPFIFSGIDPNSGEVLVSVPRVLENPPKGYLPDYPDMADFFDIWDGQAKSIVYNLYAEPNNWGGAFNITAEGFVYAGNVLYGFKNGGLWKFGKETAPFNNFFGVQYKSRIMFLCNVNPNKPKVLNNISLEANKTPSLTYFRTEDPYIQASDLLDFDWEFKEGQRYADVYNDKLTPTATGLQTNGLITGDKLRSIVIKVMMQFDVEDGPLEFRFASIGFSISLGHTT